MKRFLNLVLCATLAMGLASSCSSEDPDYHTIGISSTTVKTIPVRYYADQLTDTLLILSTDTWQANTNASWMTFAKTNSAKCSGEVTYSYGAQFTFKETVKLQANQGADFRETDVNVSANGKTIVLKVSQSNRLNVTDPMVTPEGGNPMDVGRFVKTVDKNATATTIGFRVFNSAELTTTADWITLSQTEFAADTHTTNLTMQPNTTGTTREGVVSLKSSTGVVTDIIIRQKG